MLVCIGEDGWKFGFGSRGMLPSELSRVPCKLSRAAWAMVSLAGEFSPSRFILSTRCVHHIRVR